MEDLVNKLRCYAEDLHSAGGFNGYASAMSLAADEIVKLREYVAMMDADMIATIKQRDAAEREACVKLVWDTPTQADDEYVSHKETIAKAIRARGGE